MSRLQESEVIPSERRKAFIQQVFWNIREILVVNTRLRDALSKRQKSYAVVDRIGDIFLEHVPHFGPFVAYGAHQLYGKYEFEREKGQNPTFAAFVEVRFFALGCVSLLILPRRLRSVCQSHVNLSSMPSSPNRQLVSPGTRSCLKPYSNIHRMTVLTKR